MEAVVAADNPPRNRPRLVDLAHPLEAPAAVGATLAAAVAVDPLMEVVGEAAQADRADQVPLLPKGHLARPPWGTAGRRGGP